MMNRIIANHQYRWLVFYCLKLGERIVDYEIHRISRRESGDQRQIAATRSDGELAKIEDMTEIPGVCCDEYCKYPDRCRRQEELDEFCTECELAPLFEMLLSK